MPKNEKSSSDGEISSELFSLDGVDYLLEHCDEAILVRLRCADGSIKLIGAIIIRCKDELCAIVNIKKKTHIGGLTTITDCVRTIAQHYLAGK